MNKLYILLILYLFSLNVNAQRKEDPEYFVPASKREKYLEEAKKFIEERFYPFLSESYELDSRDSFLEYEFAEDARFRPEFYTTGRLNEKYVTPLEYVSEFGRIYASYLGRSEVMFEIDNICFNDKLYAPDDHRCYAIAEYDLTLLIDGVPKFKHRCEAYCLFPDKSVFRRVCMWQVTPIKDFPLTIPYKNTGQEVAGEWKRATVSDAIRLFNEKHYSESFEMFLNMNKGGLSENGDVEFYLGYSYSEGLGVDRNYAEAVKWFRKAASQGNVRAQTNLGHCYYNGKGIDRNDAEAVKWYQKAADQGNAEAQTGLANYYHNRSIGEFLKWYQKAAEGDAKAQTVLAGLDQDYAEAVKWYHKAADQGNVEAQTNLGYCYSNGFIDRNYAEAFKWFRKAADQGNVEAQTHLAICYYRGEGINLNYAEAFKWFRKAASQGYAFAQSYLGDCYYYGRGTDRNYAEAFKWFRKAAGQGNGEAQTDLANCYYYGRGIAQNYSEAFKWYRKAAYQGGG